MKPSPPLILVILPICAKSLEICYCRSFYNHRLRHEKGQFNVNQVIQGIHSKIVRRHPHVFGDLKLEGVDGVLANWEKLKEAGKKRKEKRGKRVVGRRTSCATRPFTGAGISGPRRAVGFDWTEIDGVLDKITEEINEIKNAETDFELASEIGDLFFVLVNFSRWKKVDLSLRCVAQI